MEMPRRQLISLGGSVVAVGAGRMERDGASNARVGWRGMLSWWRELRRRREGDKTNEENASSWP